MRFPSYGGPIAAVPPPIYRDGFNPLWSSCRFCKKTRPLEYYYGACLVCCKKHNLNIPMKKGCSVTVSKNPKAKFSESPGLATMGPVAPSRPYITTQPSQNSVLLALYRKVNQLTYVPERGIWDEVQRSVNASLATTNPTLPRDLQPKEFEAWLRDATMSTGNKAKIRIAAGRMRCDPNSKKWISRACRISLFPKRDKYDKYGHFEVDKAFFNRPISAFSPEANVATGPSVASIQHYLHKEWDDWLFFAAGKNGEDLARWFNACDHSWQIIEDDFGQFDASQSLPVQKFLVWFYEKTGIFKNDSRFKKYKCAQSYKTNGGTSFGVKFKVVGTMKSGASDTCLGNTLVNVFAHLYCLAKINNTTIASLKSKVRMAALGDDNLAFVHPSLTTKGLEEQMIKLGFLAKTLRKKRVEDIVFLNQRPYRVGEEYVWAPLIGRLISRLFWTTKSPRDPLVYTSEIVRAFMTTANHVPILNDFLMRIWYLTSPEVIGVNKHRRGFNLTDEMYLKIVNQSPSMESQETRDMVMSIYGLSSLDFDQLRHYIQTLPSLTTTLSHPLLDRLFDVDLG